MGEQEETSNAEMIDAVEGVSASMGSRLRKLMEKRQELLEKGNKYGETFTERQWKLAVEPIIRSEYIRSRILLLTSEKVLSVKEIAASLELPSKEVLQHITTLRRRNLIDLDHVDGTSPKYRAVELGEERQ